jgi:hypothetical protein
MLETQVRNRLAEINPNLMVERFRSLAEQVQLGFSQQKMIVQLTSLFGLVALALAAIGLYGVTAYAVAQRTSEIGIRMALGANRLDVQRMVLRGAFLQVGLGLVIGIPAAVEAGAFDVRGAVWRGRDQSAGAGSHGRSAAAGIAAGVIAACGARRGRGADGGVAGRVELSGERGAGSGERGAGHRAPPQRSAFSVQRSAFSVQRSAFSKADLWDEGCFAVTSGRENFPSAGTRTSTIP